MLSDIKNGIISLQYLRQNPDHIFVFGDNKIGKGKKGAAILRDEPNSYGFITKKFPNYDSSSYYKPAEYKNIFDKEISKLMDLIEKSPDKTFLISRIGGNLANKFGIFEKVILPQIFVLKKYSNVIFLFDK